MYIQTCLEPSPKGVHKLAAYDMGPLSTGSFAQYFGLMNPWKVYWILQTVLILNTVAPLDRFCLFKPEDH